jgi:hypothetical protein
LCLLSSDFLDALFVRSTGLARNEIMGLRGAGLYGGLLRDLWLRARVERVVARDGK